MFVFTVGHRPRVSVVNLLAESWICRSRPSVRLALR